jgi:2-(1,2-epoxy-1,2-dihydrophenyl)acetyl-CoA isomerase
MNETAEILIRDLTDGVLTLKLNRPPVNAFNFELIAALRAALKDAKRDHEVRCLLITGCGETFSAGQDITVFEDLEDIPFRYHLKRTYNPLILEIRRLEKPVIAAVNGPVSGAALGMALACDLRIAADTARFVVGFSRLGLAPDSAVSLLLPALIGIGRAAEFAFTRSSISAEQALAWGLVNRVAPAAEIDDQAASWAAELADGPQRVIGLTKRAFNKAVLKDLEGILDYEAHLQEIAGHGAEHKEGVKAFLEKRWPDFQDR